MWKAINSAPKDQSVLVRYKDAVGEVYDVGFNFEGSGIWLCGGARIEQRQLTHWHPLPEPPSAY